MGKHVGLYAKFRKENPYETTSKMGTGAVLTKRGISKKIKIRETLLWLVIGAAISRFGDLITLAEKAVVSLKKFAGGQ